MNEASFAAPPATRAGYSGALPWLLILFVGSGCSALIYEIVWYQMLQLAIGSTAVSLGVLLATFMGGLCIGSLVLPRVLARYARCIRCASTPLIELGIGVFGTAVQLVADPAGRHGLRRRASRTACRRCCCAR